MTGLVSVLLPTHIRRPWLQQAIDCYLSQDWPEKELVVVDEGECRDMFDAIPEQELVYFKDRPGIHNLSMKLNIGCRIARGDVITHQFSDDWSSPDRIGHQIRHLLALGAEVGGYHTAMFYNEVEKQASCYHGYANYAWGPNLIYTKAFWNRYPWPEDVKYAEDAHFVRCAQHLGVISAQDGQGKIVMRLHSANAHRTTGTEKWPNIPFEDLPAGFRALVQ